MSKNLWFFLGGPVQLKKTPCIFKYKWAFNQFRVFSGRERRPHHRENQHAVPTAHNNETWNTTNFVNCTYLLALRFVHFTFRASTRPKQCVIDAYKGLRPTKASNTFVQQLGLQGKRAKQVGRGDHHSSLLMNIGKVFSHLFAPFNPEQIVDAASDRAPV